MSELTMRQQSPESAAPLTFTGLYAGFHVIASSVALDFVAFGSSVDFGHSRQRLFSAGKKTLTSL